MDYIAKRRRKANLLLHQALELLRFEQERKKREAEAIAKVRAHAVATRRADEAAARLRHQELVRAAAAEVQQHRSNGGFLH